MKSTYTCDIDCPREKVFAFLDDPDNLPKYVPNLVDHGVIKETPEKVGTTFWHEYEENGRKMKMNGVVTVHEPPTRMAVEVDGAMFGIKVLYELEELGPDKTRVIQHSDANFKHVFKMMGLLFRKKMEVEGRKAQDAVYANMKRILEEGEAS